MYPLVRKNTRNSCDMSIDAWWKFSKCQKDNSSSTSVHLFSFKLDIVATTLGARVFVCDCKGQVLTSLSISGWLQWWWLYCERKKKEINSDTWIVKCSPSQASSARKVFKHWTAQKKVFSWEWSHEREREDHFSLLQKNKYQLIRIRGRIDVTRTINEMIIMIRERYVTEDGK